MRSRTIRISLAVIALIAVGAVAWYLGSPLLIDQTVEEQLPIEIPSQAEMEAMSESELEQLTTEAMETAATMPDKPMEEDMPSDGELVAVRSGAVQGADRFHQGEGVATIYELPDGSFVLRLEAFMVTNGPDLHVLLATGSNPEDRSSLGEYIDLGELKGNIGNQNYELPDGIDLDTFNSVVIYCLPFHVVFATATL